MDGGVLRQQVQTQWCFLFISNSSLWTCDSLSNILWTLSVVLWQMCREQLCSHEALRGICDHFHSLVHFHTPHFKLILTSLPLLFLVKKSQWTLNLLGGLGSPLFQEILWISDALSFAFLPLSFPNYASYCFVVLVIWVDHELYENRNLTFVIFNAQDTTQNMTHGTFLGRLVEWN